MLIIFSVLYVERKCIRAKDWLRTKWESRKVIRIRHTMKSRNHHWSGAEQSTRPFEWISHVSPDKSQTNFQDPQLICNRRICSEVLLPDLLPPFDINVSLCFARCTIIIQKCNYSSCVSLWYMLTLIIVNDIR